LNCLLVLNMYLGTLDNKIFRIHHKLDTNKDVQLMYIYYVYNLFNGSDPTSNQISMCLHNYIMLTPKMSPPKHSIYLSEGLEIIL